MASIESTWQRIDTWLKTHTRGVWEQFQLGVSEEAILQAEATLGTQLPEDLKASYRLHNGCSGFGNMLLMGRWFYPLEGMIGTWKMMKDLLEAGDFDPDFAQFLNRNQPGLCPDEPIRPVWWHLQWLPFAGNASGEEWCLDLAPTASGHPGQIIRWEHEVGPNRLLFPDFGTLLTTYASDLESGHYTLSGSDLVWNQPDPPRHLRPRSPQESEYAPAKRLLKQALSFRRAGANQEMMASLLAVLQLEEVFIEDRLLTYEWIIEHYLSRDEFEQVREYVAQCQVEAKLVPEHYWIHRTLQELLANGEIFPDQAET